MRFFVTVFLFLITPLAIQAHHNTQTEFGWFDEETKYAEGEIKRIRWGNPHVMVDVEITSSEGDFTAGESWRLISHPVAIMTAHGFDGSEFAVGDSLKFHGHAHLRDHPLLWLRAVQVNDGPMRSSMRFNDMIDIANGVFEAKNMLPAANTSGSPPGRAGAENVEKLRAMGLIDDDGLMIWPPP